MLWVRARSVGSLKSSLPRVSTSSSTGRTVAAVQWRRSWRKASTTSRKPGKSSSQARPSSQSSSGLGKTKRSGCLALSRARARRCTGSGSSSWDGADASSDASGLPRRGHQTSFHRAGRWVGSWGRLR